MVFQEASELAILAGCGAAPFMGPLPQPRSARPGPTGIGTGTGIGAYLRRTRIIDRIPEPAARVLAPCDRDPLHLGDDRDVRGRVRVLVAPPHHQHPPGDGMVRCNEPILATQPGHCGEGAARPYPSR